MSIEFVLKDQSGQVLVDLTGNLCRFSEEQNYSLPSNGLSTVIIDLDDISKQNRHWVYVAHTGLNISNVSTLSTLSNGASAVIINQAQALKSINTHLKAAASKMKNDRCYLVIYDNRWLFGQAFRQRFTIYLGQC